MARDQNRLGSSSRASSASLSHHSIILGTTSHPKIESSELSSLSVAYPFSLSPRPGLSLLSLALHPTLPRLPCHILPELCLYVEWQLGIGLSGPSCSPLFLYAVSLSLAVLLSRRLALALSCSHAVSLLHCLALTLSYSRTVLLLFSRPRFLPWPLPCALPCVRSLAPPSPLSSLPLPLTLLRPPSPSPVPLCSPSPSPSLLYYSYKRCT